MLLSCQCSTGEERALQRGSSHGQTWWQQVRRMRSGTQQPPPAPCSRSRASPSPAAPRRTRVEDPRQVSGRLGHPQPSSPGHPAGNAHRRDCQKACPHARRDTGPQDCSQTGRACFGGPQHKSPTESSSSQAHLPALAAFC